MKKQKWAVVFAALLAMVGFSSCLSSEDDGVRTLEDYAEVNSSSFGGLSFTSMYGSVCEPNKTVTSTPESKLAYIAYQYNNADMQALTSTSTNLPVTLLYDPVYFTRCRIIKDQQKFITADTVSTASFIGNGKQFL